MEFPSHSESAFKKAKRISAERAVAPQVTSLPLYVPPPLVPAAAVAVANTQRRVTASTVVVVRNDDSHIFLRSRYKKLYEELQEKTRKKSTPLSSSVKRRVTISEQISNSSKKAATPKPTLGEKRTRPDDVEDDWK